MRPQHNSETSSHRNDAEFFNTGLGSSILSKVTVAKLSSKFMHKLAFRGKDCISKHLSITVNGSTVNGVDQQLFFNILDSYPFFLIIYFLFIYFISFIYLFTYSSLLFLLHGKMSYAFRWFYFH